MSICVLCSKTIMLIPLILGVYILKSHSRLVQFLEGAKLYMTIHEVVFHLFPFLLISLKSGGFWCEVLLFWAFPVMKHIVSL